MSRCLDVGSSVEGKIRFSKSLAGDRFSDLAPLKSHLELLVRTVKNFLTRKKNECKFLSDYKMEAPLLLI